MIENQNTEKLKMGKKKAKLVSIQRPELALKQRKRQNDPLHNLGKQKDLISRGLDEVITQDTLLPWQRQTNSVCVR